MNRGNVSRWVQRGLSVIYVLSALVLPIFLAIAVSWVWLVIVPLIYICIFALMFPRIETMRQIIHLVRFLLIIGGFFITYYVIGSDFRPEMEFFTVAAQVIPVLGLALVLEARMLGNFYDTGDFILSLLAIGVLGYGEFTALKAIAEGGSGVAAGDTTAAAIAAGFAGVLAGALGRADDDG